MKLPTSPKKTWMTKNQLKLNDNKTSTSLSIFIFLETFHHFLPWLDYSWLSQHTPSLILPGILELKIFQTAYFELKCISLICRFLTEDAAQTLVTSYILSWLNYCNCLLMGTPNSVTQPLHKIQNSAARLVLLAPCHQHSAPLLEKLHWLSISKCIKYKVACMCFSAINGSSPAYLSELLHVNTVSYTVLLFWYPHAEK